MGHCGCRQGLSADEEADEHGEGLLGLRPQPKRREPLVEGEAAIVADEPLDADLGVADLLQAFAEPREPLVAAQEASPTS
ncbi:MAG TPA: hypothetical protein VM049_07820 [Gaiellaceae bacterium]|nr:hypothetical protein [Gaiellaceae bacterium]